MGRYWGGIAGVIAVLAVSATPSEAQVQIGVGGFDRFGVGVSVGPRVYADRYYGPYSRPARIYRARPNVLRARDWSRWNRELRNDIRRAAREYRRELREAVRDRERDIRDRWRDRRRR